VKVEKFKKSKKDFLTSNLVAKLRLLIIEMDITYIYVWFLFNFV